MMEPTRSKRNQKLLTGIGTAVVLAILYFSWHSTPGDSSTRALVYFSNDDGTSFFAEDPAKLAELERQSKPAYVAGVFSCDGNGGHRFVAYLTRESLEDLTAIDQAKAQADETRSKYPFNDAHVARAEDTVTEKLSAAKAHTEIKRPGSSNAWTSINEAAGQDMLNNVKCPAGSSGVPQMVTP
jgi:hypothetical protein